MKTTKAVATRRQALAKSDRAKVKISVERSLSDNTRRAYQVGWQAWLEFCAERGYSELPAEPSEIAAFALALAEAGRKMATIKSRIAAIGFAHRIRLSDAANPTQTETVKRVLHSIARDIGTAQKQASPITAEALAAIRATESDPINLALVHLAADSGLRRSEIADLTWSNIDLAEGIIFVARSKTDQAGSGAYVAITARTIEYLAAIQPPELAEHDHLPVFGFGDQAANLRIKRMTKQAGLKGDYSAHSTRVGMAVRMTSNGATTPLIARQGRWKTSRMINRYTEQQTAGDAVRFLC